MQLENTTDHAIYLSLSKDSETLVVPRATRKKVTNEKTGDDHIEVTNGVADIDEAKLIEIKKNSVVARYFSSGQLKTNGSGPPPASAGQSSKGK